MTEPKRIDLLAAFKAAKNKPPEPDPIEDYAAFGAPRTTASCQRCGYTAAIQGLMKMQNGRYQCPPRRGCSNRKHRRKRHPTKPAV